MTDNKKISFGFSKSSKKVNLLAKPTAITEGNKVHLIDYVEDQSIKVIGDDSNKPKTPLVIPMKQQNKKLYNLIEIVKNDFKEDEPEKNTPKESADESLESGDEKKLSLDELAAKELLNASDKPEDDTKSFSVIQAPDAPLSLDGEKEPTLEDYENIPIADFGLAMLRGMGWKDGEGIGKNQVLVKPVQPSLRPKGMGLGADTFLKKHVAEKPTVDKTGKVLTCKKGAYVKVIAGYHKGSYGQIMGLDDESGRFIIKTALNNMNISLNEFLVLPVTKEDYDKNSKVINNAKYEEYMKMKELKEKQEGTKQIKQESNSEEDKKHNISKESTSGTNKNITEKNIKSEIKEESYKTDREKYKTHRNKDDRGRERNDDKYYRDRSVERDKNGSRKHKESSSDDSEKESSRISLKSKHETDSRNKEKSKKKHRKKSRRRSSSRSNNSSGEESHEKHRSKSRKSSSRKYKSDESDDHSKHKKRKSRDKKHKSSSPKDSYKERHRDNSDRRK